MLATVVRSFATLRAQLADRLVKDGTVRTDGSETPNGHQRIGHAERRSGELRRPRPLSTFMTCDGQTRYDEVHA